MAKRKSWAIRLEDAEKRGRFIPYERQLAESWTSCAVGEKHEFKDYGLPRWGSPEGVLGMKFFAAVQEDNIPEAKRLYAEIMAL